MAHLVDVIKYEGDNSTFVWKHPKEDFKTHSQLIVHESQEALFFLNGQALDLFGPGRYDLETQNMPMVSKFFKKIAGGEQAFHGEVYFINKTVQMSIKWGTPELIRFVEPTLGIPLVIGASGHLNLAVSDSRKLVAKLVGTMSGIAWNSDEREDREDIRRAGGNNVDLEEKKAKRFTQSLVNCFRPLIATAVKTHLASTIKQNNIDLIEIDENLDILSEALRKPINEGFEEYGLTVPQFYVTTVNLPENDRNFQKLRELHTLTLQKRMMEAETEIIAKRAEEDAAARAAKIEADTTVERKLAEADAERKIARAKADTQIAEAEVGAKVAKRASILEDETTETELARRKAERDIIQAQVEAEKAKLSGFAEADVMKAKGLAEAEEMRAKGYTQRDVLQADVQKSYADALGNMEFSGSAGGGLAGGIVSDMVSLGAGFAVAGKVGSQMSSMMDNIQFPNANSAPAQESASCPSCGASISANAKFCPECGAKVERLAENEVICPSCGQKTAKGKFCQECGASLIRKCKECGAEIPNGAKFCLECGAKQ